MQSIVAPEKWRTRKLEIHGRDTAFTRVADSLIFAHCIKKATSSLIAVARPTMKKGREYLCMLSH